MPSTFSNSGRLNNIRVIYIDKLLRINIQKTVKKVKWSKIIKDKEQQPKAQILNKIDQELHTVFPILRLITPSKFCPI